MPAGRRVVLTGTTLCTRFPALLTMLSTYFLRVRLWYRHTQHFGMFDPFKYLFTNCNTLNARSQGIIPWKVYDNFFTFFGDKPHIIQISPYSNHIDWLLYMCIITFLTHLKYCAIVNILIYWSSYREVIYKHYKMYRAWYSFAHFYLLCKFCLFYLQVFGISPHILRWMAAFVLARTQRVKIGNNYSYTGHHNGGSTTWNYLWTQIIHDVYKLFIDASSPV